MTRRAFLRSLPPLPLGEGGGEGVTRRAFLRDVARLGGAVAGLGVLGGCMLAPPAAPPPARVYRVGALSTAGSAQLTTFKTRMAELGYIEGQNLVVEERRGPEPGEDGPSLRDLADELVRLGVDVIAVQAGPTVPAALDATASIPIVLMGVTADPVAEGIVESFARPGGNVTGVTGAPPEVELKRLQLLVEAAPAARRVAVLAVAPLEQSTLPWQSTAAYLGVTLLTPRLSAPTDPDAAGRYEAAIDAAVAQGADALLLRTGTGGAQQTALVSRLAERHRLPAMYVTRGPVNAGGLMTYTPRTADAQRRAAEFVDRILRGARPADLPVETPTRYDLILNMRAARAIGLTLSRDFMIQVDEVIE